MSHKSLSNTRGVGLIAISVILGAIVAVIAGVLFSMVEIQQRDLARESALRAGKDANLVSLELLNQLIQTKVIQGFTVPPDFVHGFFQAEPAQGFRWKFQDGFTKSLGSAPTATLEVSSCDTRKLSVDQLLGMYSPTPKLTSSCPKARTEIVVTNIKNGNHMELSVRSY